MSEIEPTAADRELAEEIWLRFCADDITNDFNHEKAAIATLIARHVAEREAGLRAPLTDKLVDAAMTIMHCHPDEVERKREKLTVAFMRILSKATENTT